MANGTRAKIDRLRLVLGDEFPEPLPSPEPAAPSASANVVSDASEMGICVQEHDPTPKVVVEGSQNDSDPDTVHRPAVKQKKKKKARPKQKADTAARAIMPYRMSPQLQRFTPDPVRYGKLAPAHHAFCPIMAVSRYPYKFVASDISEEIADKFFNAGKFWNRIWDVYYVWPPIALSAKPVLLVPVEQVDQLLDAIYFGFGASSNYFLTLGDEAKDFGLVNQFPAHPNLRPRFLGRSGNREAFLTMENSVPSESFRPSGESQPATAPDSESLRYHERIMELILEVSRNKTKPAKKASKKETQLRRKRDYKHELRRAEEFLGFRPTPRQLAEPGPEASWDELQAYHEAKSSHRKLTATNPELPAPFDFESLPIFICIDVECYELAKEFITELGVATLDTADLSGHAPGKHGKNWHQFIKARHLRIREHAHMYNSLYVPDASAHFEFPKGGSEFISLSEASKKLKSLFRPPFCDIDRPWLATSQADGDEMNNSTNQEQSYEANTFDANNEEGGVELEVPSSSTVDSANVDFEDANKLIVPNPGSTIDHDASESSSIHDARSDESTLAESTEPEDADLDIVPDRTLILVGHDITSDIYYIKKSFHMDLDKLGTSHTIDTANLYRAHEHAWNATSLSAILTSYDMVPWHAHNAGNDAVYTLWAMIALVLAHVQERGDVEAKKRFEVRKKQRELDAIVRAGLTERDMAEGWESEAEI